MDKISWESNKHKNPAGLKSSIVSIEKMQKTLGYHRTLPNYAPTPLVSCKALAGHLDLSSVLIKDESSRFELNSFKVLGSSFALAAYLASEHDIVLDSFSHLKEKMKTFPQRTFASATAGNHGRGLAWAAKQLGQHAAIYLPKGSSEYRLNKVREEGAQAEITTLNYDDSVRYVSKLAQDKGWIVVQDTSWENYVDIPALIMQGYLTILGECLEQMPSLVHEAPTHVILQAGVGSFAGSIAGVLKQLYGDKVFIIIAEPSKADCFFQSSLTKDGTPAKASRDLNSMMAGLCCGELNPIAWNILRDAVDVFAVCPDSVAAKGMRILGNPMGGDQKILAGESGALPIGFLSEICTNTSLKDLKKYAGLNGSSNVLVINTEGITDPQNYWAVCWDGKNEKP